MARVSGRPASSSRSVGIFSIWVTAIRHGCISQGGPRGVDRIPFPLSAPTTTLPSTRRRRLPVGHTAATSPLFATRLVSMGGVVPILNAVVTPPITHPVPVAASGYADIGGSGALLAPALAALGWHLSCGAPHSASHCLRPAALWRPGRARYLPRASSARRRCGPLGVSARRRRRRRGGRLMEWLGMVAPIGAAITID